MSWLTQATGENQIHVVPLKDQLDHEFDHECWCKPWSEVIQFGATIWVHNAKDGREVHERKKALN